MVLNKRFRILSIDGGGVRGLLPSVVLARIQQMTGVHPTELFDLMIGTSTGSIIISVLNIKDPDSQKPKYNTSDVLEVYMKECPKVFSPSAWKNLTSIYGIYGGRFSTKLRDELFQQWLGDTKISETINDIVIPSFDMCSKTPVFFKTRKGRLNESDNHSIQDSVKAGLSAPTIFSPHQIGDRLYMDALYGKNPTMFGIIEALRHYNVTLVDIDVLSLGTGYSEDGNAESIQMTVQSGVSFLMEVFSSTVNGNTISTQYMTKQLLPNDDQCLRIDFFLESKHMGICDVSSKNLCHLYEHAHNCVDRETINLANFCMRLARDKRSLERLNNVIEQHHAASIPLPEETT